MIKRSLSKLSKMELRDVWGHEAIDFTKWLSQKENLELLSEEIGVSINLVGIEANVGRFNVDILAEEESNGRKIIIENQLEGTNHDHLGKIITYASGYDAKIIIWITKDFRDEHKNAVEWLNEHTDEEINFFLIQVELWQIDGSNPAPKFDIITRPNEWAKTIKQNSSNGELTKTKLLQLDFWTSFKEFVDRKGDSMRLQTPRPQHWYDVSMGSSDAHLALTINSRDNSLGCEIYIPKNKQLYNFLLENKEAIELTLGSDLKWTDANRASIIKIKKQVTKIFDEEKKEEYFNWMLEEIIVFKKEFSRYIDIFKKL